VKLALTISPKRVLRAMVAAVVAAMVAGVAVLLMSRAPWYDRIPGNRSYYAIFHIGCEGCVPAWLSSSLLLVSSGLCGIVAALKGQCGDRWKRHWAALAVIFAYLSVDEAAEIHEKLSLIVKLIVPAEGILHYPWVVGGVAAVAVFVLVYARFVVHLPRRTATLFLLAGASYVGGAVGMEMVDGAYIDVFGRDLTYSALVHIEESLELVGVVLFAYALIDYLRAWIGDFQVKIEEHTTS